jgi:hypothetical protein
MDKTTRKTHASSTLPAPTCVRLHNFQYDKKEHVVRHTFKRLQPLRLDKELALRVCRLGLGLCQALL